VYEVKFLNFIKMSIRWNRIKTTHFSLVGFNTYFVRNYCKNRTKLTWLSPKLLIVNLITSWPLSLTWRL